MLPNFNNNRRPGVIPQVRSSEMYLESQLSWNVIIPAENLNVEGLMLQKAIVVRLLEDFASKKASKNLGYFMAVTTLEKIGEGRVREHTGDVLFPVEFSCVTFKIFRGEILEGVVDKILKHGVFLRCGPTTKVYLSHQKMSDYKYVPGENPIFMNEKMSRIEKDTVVRFIVVGARYVEAEKEVQAVVSLEGDYLGPISQSSV
ncbi:DNA-directed RNA polymerase V subunit 7-like isoform X1 [Lycium barbarum]|uniref:DNA-directed RNA polymerase V subunit 7-like isoform X1 n=2 Tax=Lycium barbarum TaxID=112863 RepID=UPI00293ED393|nr:DNA-directed RNA polymerase V subunit 7-like isoform X1 [Lycium barbarum]